MSEPTRQEIKEEFKKTIKRWEKIAEDVGYFHKSECLLCLLESLDGEHYVCSQSCPIRLYTENVSCNGTPYTTFFSDKTPENALAELNFLRKVYIWWMEEKEKDKKWEGLTGYVKEEKKKEEWHDIPTENLVVEIKDCGKSLGCYFVITDNDELRIIAKRECYIDKENHLHMKFNESYSSKYNVIVENGNFRILRKS